MRYILQRLLQFVIVFFVVTFVVMVFAAHRARPPGDPARTCSAGPPTRSRSSRSTRSTTSTSNYLVQYWYWLKDMLTGDFGLLGAATTSGAPT